MRTERLALAGGAAYVLAVLVGNTLYAGTSGEDGAAVLAELRRPLTAAQTTGLVLEVFGFVALLSFLGALHGSLRRREGTNGWLATTALGAGLVGTAVKLGSIAPVMAARAGADGMDADLARVLIDLNGAAFVVGGFTTGLFVAAAAVAAGTTRLLPRWLSMAGAVVGVLATAAGTAGITDPAGYVPIPFLLCLLWIAVTGVLLAVRGPSTDGGAPGRATGAVQAGAPQAG